MATCHSADWLLLFGFVAYLAAVTGKNDKIVGGQLSPPIPYVTSVQKDGHHFCGGSLLTLSSVLTACHCVGIFPQDEDDQASERIKIHSPYYYKIFAGHTDIHTSSDAWQIRQVETLQPHPKCGKVQGIMEWDFAIIVTKWPFTLTKYVRPAKLYSLDKDLFEERISRINDESHCIVVGWGREDVDQKSPPTSRYLKYAEMKIIPSTLCRELLSFKSILFYSYEFKDKAQMCVLGVDGYESDCTGDSGGPFICDELIVGTVSYGFECGRPDEPAVYTKLSDFVEWYSGVKDTIERSAVPKLLSLTLLKWTVVINLLKM